jgi:DNA-binding transcriptional ArsR family regulator
MSEDSRVCTFGVDSPFVDLAVEVFAMLADATRVRIVLALRGGELSVNNLAAMVGKSPTVASQHLAKLRLGRVVAARHDGTRVFYRLVDEHARDLVVDAVFQAEHALGGVPAHHRVTASVPTVRAPEAALAAGPA